MVVEQPQDEQLLLTLETDDPIQTGACDVDPMLDNLKIQFYATEAAALVDWPDAQVWVF